MSILHILVCLSKKVSNLRKIKILLDALETAEKNVDYYALDLDRSELQRTLSAVPSYKHVRCSGLHGTYDDGLAWLKQYEARPKTILWLGEWFVCLEGRSDDKKAAQSATSHELMQKHSSERLLLA